MDTEESHRQIREATESAESEPEIENGHEEISGGSETPPAEKADELTTPSVGDVGEEEIHFEVPFGGSPTPIEVEGYVEEIRRELNQVNGKSRKEYNR